MNNKLIQELTDTIANSSISYSELENLGNELYLLQLYASESVTFEIIAK